MTASDRLCTKVQLLKLGKDKRQPKLKAWELAKLSQAQDFGFQDSTLGSSTFGDGDLFMTNLGSHLRNTSLTESQIDSYIHCVNSRTFCMSSHRYSRSSQKSIKANRYG